MKPVLSAPRFLLGVSLVFLPVACSSGNAPPNKTDGGTHDGPLDTSAAGGFLGSGGTSGFGTAGTPGSGGIPTAGVVTTSGGVSGTGGISVPGGVTTSGGRSVTGGITVTGGATGSGGTTSTGVSVTGGSTSSGGVTGTGGVSSPGGAITSGGTSATAGMIVTGGSTSSGGVTGTGGVSAPGGATTSGGTSATGGISAPGGATTSGGTSANGGTSATGGVTASGGVTGTGGTAGSGGGTGSGGTTGSGGEYGFTYRSPGSHTVSCTGPLGTLTITSPDMDWLCTFNQANQKGVIYVRSTVTSANCLAMGAMPIYTTELAQISIDGVVTSLAQAQYSYGDVHNNDYLTIDYQGATYKYYHSSIGYGNRRCQPMDCIDIYALDTPTLQTEGCSPARALPEVCVQIKTGGTHAALVDTFTKCPGDVSP